MRKEFQPEVIIKFREEYNNCDFGKYSYVIFLIPIWQLFETLKKIAAKGQSSERK